MRRPWPAGGCHAKNKYKPPINISKFNVFPNLTFDCSDNKTVIAHNSIHISALLNNLIVNTNSGTSINNTLSQVANMPKCFDLLQVILREFYIKQAYIKCR
jgi:hypothetical protein